jgi:hypothetical protein
MTALELRAEPKQYLCEDERQGLCLALLKIRNLPTRWPNIYRTMRAVNAGSSIEGMPFSNTGKH